MCVVIDRPTMDIRRQVARQAISLPEAKAEKAKAFLTQRRKDRKERQREGRFDL